MSSRFLATLMACVSVIACFCPASAEAQVGRRFSRRAAIAEAPVVEGAVARGRNLIGRIRDRRLARMLAADEAATQEQKAAQQKTKKPQTAAPQKTAPQQASANRPPAPVLPARPLPTPEQLATMNEQALFATWRDMTDRLQEELGQLTTAAGWQRHLGPSKEAMSEPGVQLSQVPPGELQKLLNRFDKVSANPGYAKISGQPSFDANRAVLLEMVSRTHGPELGQATGGVVQAQAVVDDSSEVLPTPAVVEEPVGTRAEHSILKP